TAEWAFPNGKVPGAPAMINSMNDDGTLDVKVGWPVDTQATPPEPIELYVCKSGRAAVHTHVGEYAELHSIYRRLWEALAADGIEPKGEPRELYETSPEEVSDPSEHRTRIIWPLDV